MWLKLLISIHLMFGALFALTPNVSSVKDNSANSNGLSAYSESCPDYFRNDVRVPCYFLLEKCYCFSTQLFLMTWNDAKYYCRLSNYTLISIETKIEDDVIHQHINNTEGLLEQPWFWTSGSYSEDQWKWSTGPYPGQPFNYSNWASTRPVYNLDGYCTEINYSTFQGGWADFPCDFTNFFICEGNVTLPV
ncbi:hypothetical protein GHT06_007627 [Daphnia sinensis]|uniref:C-type lectin domain-containing protein n=1 Tax=Daphnia sinensis TaxID=1820382 RepID=A0AAD5PK78_9CRUS|nr:hypothetical protein GHT06_007627 [Daphnia sinensis]